LNEAVLSSYQSFFSSYLLVTKMAINEAGKFSTNEYSLFGPDEYHKEGCYIYTACSSSSWLAILQKD